MARPAIKETPLWLPVAVIVGADIILSFGDALVRAFGGQFGLWQIFLLRAALVLPILVVICRAAKQSIWPSDLRWVLIRSVCLVVMWLTYYSALPVVPMATAAAGYYTIPILIAFLSASVSNDRIGRQGWVGVFLGFLGVLLIVRPGTDGLNLFLVLPIIAAALYAVAMVATREKLSGESPVVLTLWVNAFFILLGGCGTYFTGWQPIETDDTWAIGAMAVATVIGTLASAYAYQNGPSALIGTFDYSYLAFAILWGILFFDEVPDVIGWFGIACIACAGLLVIWRRAG
ncbi:MAG: DMT family transporter [Pseudomonadota bacterium]